MPAPQRLLRSPSALPAESCSQHRPLSCWASLPCSPQSRWAPGGQSRPLHRKRRERFHFMKNRMWICPFFLGRRKPPGRLPPAGQRARLRTPSHRRRRASGFSDFGTQSWGRSRAGKLPLSLSGALTVPPPKGQAGRPALPSAPGLCCLLTPAGDALRPVAFLIIPNQNCISPGEGFPQPRPL